MRSIRIDLALLVALAACGSGGTDPVDTGPPPLTVTASIPTTGMVSGTSLQASVTTSTGGAVTDAIWRTSDGKIIQITSSGFITAKKAGTAQISAQSGASIGILNINVVPGPAVGIRIYTGDGQIGARNKALFDPLCTNVVDAEGNWIIGANVTYAVATGGGSIESPTTVKTDSRGISTSGFWILGPDLGTQTVTATTAEGFTVTFKATAQ